MHDYQLILPAILLLVLLNAAILLCAVGVRLHRAFRQRWVRAYVGGAEQALDEYIASQRIFTPLTEVRPWHQDVLALAITDRMSLLRGDDREAMRTLAAALGLTAHYERTLVAHRRRRRARAAQLLGCLGDAQDILPLRIRLTDGDETVRALAARALATIGTPAAARALVSALDDPSELTSLRVAENIERVKGNAVKPLLLALDGGERRGPVLAARILGNLRAQRAREQLCRAALVGEDVDLRAQAVLALGKIGDPEDLPTVYRCAHDEQWPVRTQAANAIGLIGSIESIPVLMKLMTDYEWWVRMNAARALAGLGASGVRALVEILDSDDKYARDRAAATLESEGIARQLAAQLSMTGDTGERARSAIGAMIAAGASNYLNRLASVMGDGPDRDALCRMLPMDAGDAPERYAGVQDVRR